MIYKTWGKKNKHKKKIKINKNKNNKQNNVIDMLALLLTNQLPW